ncbi:12-(S)-hydroxy-5,8,10,14-eicosatetraenoic acid receptor-like [Diretmus argenteus]
MVLVFTPGSGPGRVLTRLRAWTCQGSRDDRSQTLTDPPTQPRLRRAVRPVSPTASAPAGGSDNSSPGTTRWHLSQHQQLTSQAAPSLPSPGTSSGCQAAPTCFDTSGGGGGVLSELQKRWRPLKRRLLNLTALREKRQFQQPPGRRNIYPESPSPRPLGIAGGKMSGLGNETLDDCNTSNPVTYNVLSLLMIGQFVLGLPLNLSVLYILLFRFKFWKTKSVFLFNIVVADFLLVACLPVKAYHYQHGVRRSDTKLMCKMMLFMLFLNRGASIAFLTTLSIDRYFNVVHLGRRNFVKILKKSPQVSILIWLFLLPLTIPTMVNTFECCNSHGRKVETPSHDVTDTFRELVFFTQIIIPFIILVYCTVRTVNRLKKKTVGDKTKLRRAVYLVSSVVLVFSVCFLPCTVARAVLLAVRLKDWQDTETLVVQVYDGLMVFSYSDCLLDPLIYCFCYSGFKNAYMSSFCPAALQRMVGTTDSSTGPANTTTITTTTSGARTITTVMLGKPDRVTHVDPLV